MANSKAPKHDFAPAWLKIPSNDSFKSAGPKSADLVGDKSGRPRRDDYHGGFGRFGPGDYMYGPLQRQRSFDNYYDDRRYSPQKFRHHSGEEDPFSPPYGYNYGYNGYNYNGHYRSQPSLGKHPNPRYPQMNGAFPPPPPGPPGPYYDPYFYEYYGNDPYYNNYMRGAGVGDCMPHGPRKHRYPSGDKDKLHPRVEKDKESLNQESEEHKPIDEEFPSLNGDTDCSDAKPVKPLLSSGVWDKGPSAKLVNGKGPSVNGDGPNSSTSDGQSKENSNRQQSSVYKSLVPSKGTTIRKGGKDGGKLNGGKDLNSNHSSSKLPNSTSSSPFKLVNNKDSNKEGPCQSPTPPIEILNTRLVTTPKNLADKKSDFLRALRNEKKSASDARSSDLTDKEIINSSHSSSSDKATKGVGKESPLSNGAGPSEEPIVNGIHDLNLASSPHESVLSSSLEAEQRLLREMGWNETDDEVYEITEDEKREFEKLSKQLKEQRNGFKKTLPATWSPHHLPSVGDGEDDASSLSDSSDIDLD